MSEPSVHLTALARVASTRGQDEGAVANATDVLLDASSGIAQGARTLLAHERALTEELRDEVLRLMYERARELYVALIAYDRRASVR